MIYVGIDIAKLNHYASAIDSDEMCIRDSPYTVIFSLKCSTFKNVVISVHVTLLK